MKTLWIVRHASAEPHGHGARDFDRPLRDGGRKDLVAMVESIRESRAPLPQKIVCSPAQRTRETADLLAGELGLPLTLVEEAPPVYLAGESRLVQLIRDFDPALDCVMLVGHNPAITELLNTVCDELRVDHVPTAGVACLLLDGDWSSLGPGTARFESFDYPGAHV